MAKLLGGFHWYKKQRSKILRHCLFNAPIDGFLHVDVIEALTIVQWSCKKEFADKIASQNEIKAI